jgi:phage gp16-like protein
MPIDRTGYIKLIHVARRELEKAGQMDEATYRAMLLAVGKASSTKDMPPSSLVKVLEHMKRAGFTVRPKTPERPQQRRLATSPDARKVRALWLFLHELGAVRDPSEQALAAYVARMAKVDDLHWARGRRFDTKKSWDRPELLIESLKAWAMRVLPDAIRVLLEETRQRHQVAPLSIEQQQAAQNAAYCLVTYQSYDHHWWAWAGLRQALEMPVSPDLGDAVPVSETKDIK